MPESATNSRSRPLNSHAIDREADSDGPVIYWMSREQRVFDNWGLLHAQELARQLGSRVVVAFCLMPTCGQASARHYRFMIDGLREVERELAELGIPFRLLLGSQVEQLSQLANELNAGAVVCDFSPLSPSRTRRSALAKQLTVPLIEVDSRNIVPAWIAADKHVYAAFHLRNRYAKLLPEFLHEIPELQVRESPREHNEMPVDWDAARAFVDAPEVGPPLELPSGSSAAHDALTRFVDERLTGYADKRGLPHIDHQSGLSPYLHFGQLSAQRAVLTVRAAAAPAEDIDSFVDEAVIWRELSDNFCLHQPAYASFDGFPNWAQESLTAHADDAREVIYDLDAFEQADTHDPLWNAAQLEMVRTGKMHNYMRMYWAKKILEWSESPQEATRIAVLLNDRYELDGRDSNGYAGIAWSIGGVHDRPWQERPVYGKIRYMNYNGAKRKFDVDAYIRRVAPELLDEQLF